MMWLYVVCALFVDIVAASRISGYAISSVNVESSEMIEISNDRRKCNCEREKTDEDIKKEDQNAENAGKSLTAAYLQYNKITF